MCYVFLCPHGLCLHRGKDRYIHDTLSRSHPFLAPPQPTPCPGPLSRVPWATTQPLLSSSGLFSRTAPQISLKHHSLFKTLQYLPNSLGIKSNHQVGRRSTKSDHCLPLTGLQPHRSLPKPRSSASDVPSPQNTPPQTPCGSLPYVLRDSIQRSPKAFALNLPSSVPSRHLLTLLYFSSQHSPGMLYINLFIYQLPHSYLLLCPLVECKVHEDRHTKTHNEQSMYLFVE